MQRRGWRTLSYERKYMRSSKYRDQYFAHNKPKHGRYRCVYCGKKLRKEFVVVDHIISVSAAKQNQRLARALPHGVNDPENLVASCRKCNEQKGDCLGIWRIRAALGRHPAYFVIRKMFWFFLVCALLFLLWKYMPAEIKVKIYDICRKGILHVKDMP